MPVNRDDTYFITTQSFVKIQLSDARKIVCGRQRHRGRSVSSVPISPQMTWFLCLKIKQHINFALKMSYSKFWCCTLANFNGTLWTNHLPRTQSHPDALGCPATGFFPPFPGCFVWHCLSSLLSTPTHLPLPSYFICCFPVLFIQHQQSVRSSCLNEFFLPGNYTMPKSESHFFLFWLIASLDPHREQACSQKLIAPSIDDYIQIICCLISLNLNEDLRIRPV